MAHGKIRVNTLTYDTGSGDVDVAVSSIPNASDLAAKAPLASPALTGTPTAPTASQGTNTTQVATTAFVNAEIAADLTAAIGSTVQAFDGDTAKTDVAQTFGPAQTFTAASVHNGGLAVDGPYRQAEEDVSSGTTFDLSTGNYFAATYGASNVTLSFTNPLAAGTVHCFTIQLFINGGTITWPSSVEFPNNNTAPVLAQGKHALFVFTTDDGGVTYRGAALVDYNT